MTSSFLFAIFATRLSGERRTRRLGQIASQWTIGYRSAASRPQRDDAGGGLGVSPERHQVP